MKAVTRLKSAKGEPMEKRFYRFAKALMAVPKGEVAEGETGKPSLQKRARKRPRPSTVKK